MGNRSFPERLTQLRFWLRDRLLKYVRVNDGTYDLVFRCESRIEAKRASSLLVKEAGTVEWVRSEVRSGDVFFDVGANIGIYTLMAAQRVGTAGAVYAFEPHLANGFSLLHNARINGMQTRIHVLTCALHDHEGVFEFHYRRAVPGSSMSQLDQPRDESGGTFSPFFSELKMATTIDRLIESGIVPRPNLVKIDVDGNELCVLAGMKDLLDSDQRPRSLQVEIDPRTESGVYGFLAEHGYRKTKRHDTRSGKKKLAAGVDPQTIAYNAIFSPNG